MNRAIELKNVSAGYQQANVLHDLDFSVSEGEMTALIGPNGAGKSTLFKALTGLHHPKTGLIRLFGKNIRSISAAERARLVAVVPQELITPMAHSVEELVMIGRSAMLRPWQQPSKQDREIVEHAMAYTDTSFLRHRLLNELSGGEKQRAVVAMALAQQPRIILMDEPTTHLDMNHSIELMQLMKRLNEEQAVTVIIISHDLNMASTFCRRLIVLDHGKLVADGSPSEVLREDLIKEVYHCNARIIRDPASGTLIVVPESANLR